MQILTEAEEFAELPVRHNEDNENEHLAKQMPLEVDSRQYDSPAVKAHLLLQCLLTNTPEKHTSKSISSILRSPPLFFSTAVWQARNFFCLVFTLSPT